MSILLIILVLTQRNARNLEQQKRDKSRTDPSHKQRDDLSRQTTGKCHTSNTSIRSHYTGSRSSDTNPQGTLAKVIGMSTLAPKPSSQEILLVFLLFLLLDPFVLLSIGRRFEAESTNVEKDTDHICDRDETAEGGKCGCREGIEGEDGEKTEGDPGGLGHEGAEEFGWAFANAFEAGVFTIGEDSLEEERAHCDFVSALSC